jgi:hypothetical protein
MPTVAAILVLLILAYPRGLDAQHSAGLTTPARASTAAAWHPMTGSQTFTRQTPQTAPQPSWIARHPVLFGALVGAGAGILSGATLGEPCEEESFCRRAGLMQIGAASGAGFGALTGWLVRLVR